MATIVTSASADTQQRGFTQVPNHILYATDISYGAKALYSILLSYCWEKDSCFPSYETLMRKMQCHSQALASFLKELATHGLITIIRRGQGKTNLYQLNAVVQPAPEPTETRLEQKVETRAGEEEVCSLKIKEQELRTSKTEKYKDEIYKGGYPSNNRIGPNSGEYYVKFDSSTDKLQDSTPIIPQARVEQYKTQSNTTAQNTEEIKPHKGTMPAREKHHDIYEDINRGVLLEYMSDFAAELNDQAPLTSSTTRLYNLFRQSGLTMDAFITYLYIARAVTKERTASIRKYTETGVKARTPYFFAVLQDRLGLRQQTAILPHPSS